MKDIGNEIMLKFGRIKSADFSNNPKALELYNSNASQVDVINAFNGKFYSWWDGVYLTKKQAIEYIENYPIINP